MAVDPDKPFNREEMYLAKAAGEGTTVPDEPWSRKEAYLDKIGGRIDEAEEDISELDTKVAALATDLSYKGGVADYAHLPNDPSQGDVYTTEDTGVLYVWDGTQWVALNETPDLYSTVGRGTDGAITQAATTQMVYPFDYYSPNNYVLSSEIYIDPSMQGVTVCTSDDDTKDKIMIGRGAYIGSGGMEGIAIGGESMSTTRSVALGFKSDMSNSSGVALGAFSAADYSEVQSPAESITGVISVGNKASTSYVDNHGQTQTIQPFDRRIIHVKDPIGAHDAATKGYVDTHLGGLSFVALTQAEYDNLATKDPNTLYIIKAA